MLSFRVDADEAADARLWAIRLGIDQSELLRRALDCYLVRLREENDVEWWASHPTTEEEESFADIADCDPAEDWRELAGATG